MTNEKLQACMQLMENYAHKGSNALQVKEYVECANAAYHFPPDYAGIAFLFFIFGVMIITLYGVYKS